MVNKGGDRERCLTISKIVILQRVGTAMAAENAGVFVLSGICVLIFCTCLCVKNVNLCVNGIVDN